MWLQLVVSVDRTLADAVSEALEEQGAVSVSFEDAADEPLFEPKPGETPLWGRTRVTGLFPADVDLSAAGSQIRHRFGLAAGEYRVERLEEQVWERVWLDYFEPLRCGRRLWICPTGFEPPEKGGIAVTLDPGLAFGTGTHPTTALCLAWLDGFDLSGRSILDYGCGSGILAIAALVLGASRADALDIDPQALVATAKNGRKNGVEARLRCGLPNSYRVPTVDVVLANILATPLVELADVLCDSVQPGGQLVLSGILADQAEAVRRAYTPRIEFYDAADREGWVRLDGVRRA